MIWTPIIPPIALLIVTFLLFAPDSTELFAYQKGYEAAVQFLLVVVLGGFVAALFRNHERQQQILQTKHEAALGRMADQRESLSRFYAALLKTYNEIKKRPSTLTSYILGTRRRERDSIS